MRQVDKSTACVTSLLIAKRHARNSGGHSIPLSSWPIPATSDLIYRRTQSTTPNALPMCWSSGVNVTALSWRSWIPSARADANWTCATRSRKEGSHLMPSRELALTFDPRYVTAAIDAWRSRDLTPISPPDLERETARLLRERFVARNIMGLREQTVSVPVVTKAIGVFTALKLAKKTTKGKGEARVTILTTTT